MKHNPSRAEIRAHAYNVRSGQLEASPTVKTMATALLQKLDRDYAESEKSNRRSNRRRWYRPV